MKWTSHAESIESHVAGHSALLVDDRDRASRRFKQGATGTVDGFLTGRLIG